VGRRRNDARGLRDHDSAPEHAGGAGELRPQGGLGPEAKRLGKLVPTRPADDPEIQARIRRILLVLRVDNVLLLAIVFVMTAKPFL
jgi:hypothetical protein